MNRSRIGRAALAAASMLLAVAAPAGAQASPQAVESGARELAESYLDLAVPDVPAFAVLGIQPQNVTRPSEIRDLVATFLSAYDDDGTFNAGAAVVWSPGRTLLLPRLTRGDYREGGLGGFLRRAILVNHDLSFATTASAEDTSSVRLAVGIRFLLADAGDPLANDELFELLRREVVPLVSIPLESPQAAEEFAQRYTLAARAEAQNRVGRLRAILDSVEAASWNRFRLEMGLGTRYRLPGGAWRDREFGGVAVWLTSAHPIARRVQWLNHLRGTRDALEDTEQVIAASRLFVGQNDWGFLLEGSYRWSDESVDGDHAWGTALAGFEFKTGSGTWAEILYGVDLGHKGRPTRVLASTSLRWGILPKSPLR
jgi:hypothetical protein